MCKAFMLSKPSFSGFFNLAPRPLLPRFLQKREKVNYLRQMMSTEPQLATPPPHTTDCSTQLQSYRAERLRLKGLLKHPVVLLNLEGHGATHDGA
jgi:hypothetical protein